MSAKNAKDIRQQVRNVVKEVLPQILTEELCAAAYRQVQKHITESLAGIDSRVMETLQGINDRAQNFQGYIMREIANQTAARVEQAVTEETVGKTE